MPDRFFQKKRSKPSNNQGDLVGPSKRSKVNDEHLSESESEIDDNADQDEFFDRGDGPADESASEDENETAQDRRVRLAKLYLEGLADQEVDENAFDAAEVDKDIIGQRLKKDVLEQSGKFHLLIGDKLKLLHTRITRLHKLSLTSAVAIYNKTCTQPTIISASKDGSLVQSYLNGKGKLIARLPRRRRYEDSEGEGHHGSVLSLNVSPCGKWVCTGGVDRQVGVWDATGGDDGNKQLQFLKSLSGFKDSISGLSFRLITPSSLFVSSLDRTIKIFSFPPNPPDLPAYVETLFGHQDQILDVTNLKSDTALSVGARDKTARYWKVVDESQLVFRGGGKSKIRDVIDGALDVDAQGMDVDNNETQIDKQKSSKSKFVEGSLEACSMIDDNHFITGGDSGTISLWNLGKKKPIFNFAVAHGVHFHESETEGIIEQPRSITSLACLPFSDVFASGSYDGYIKLWKIDSKLKSFEFLTQIEAKGFINSLQILSPPRSQTNLSKDYDCNQIKSPEPINGPIEVLVVAATGQEPRLGRWQKLSNEHGKNSLVVSHFST